MKGGIGVCLLFLGIMTGDSDKMWFPIVCIGLGFALMFSEVRSENKKKVNDYTTRLDSRPKFLP